MKYITALTLLLFSLLTTTAFAEKQDHQAIKKAAASWAQAIASGNPDEIVKLYDKQALLYATFENFLNTPEQLRDYFVQLTKHKNLQVQFQNSDVRVFGDAALNSGLYTFTYEENGKTMSVPGRFTFVYYKTPKGWLIIDHHSSIMPEK